MAYSFDSKWDVSSLEDLDRRLSRVPAEAAKQVAKRNRQHANDMRNRIRAVEPVAGGFVKYRHAASKANGPSKRGKGRRGAMRGSVRTRVGSDYASIVGGGPATPYFNVNEFGGGVKWTNSSGKSHGIPVRARSQSMAQLGLENKSGTGRGAAGWFFFPTVRKYLPEIQTALVRDATAIIRRELAQLTRG